MPLLHYRPTQGSFRPLKTPTFVMNQYVRAINGLPQPRTTFYPGPQSAPPLPSMGWQSYNAGVGGPGTINGVVQAPLYVTPTYDYTYNTQRALDIQRERMGSMAEQDARKRAQYAAQPQGLAALPGWVQQVIALRNAGYHRVNGRYIDPQGNDVGSANLNGSRAWRFGPGGAMVGRPVNAAGGYDPNNATPFLADFLSAADKAQAEAKAANEARYNEIKQGYANRIADAQKDLAGLGASERQAIDDRYAQGKSSADQDLISRGLGNTTVRSSVMRGYDAQRSRDQTQLGEDLAKLRLQYLPALEGDRLQFMERRNDVPPDLGQFTNLLTALGQSGYGLPGNVGSTGDGGLAPPANSSGGTSTLMGPMERRLAMLRRLGLTPEQLPPQLQAAFSYRR